MENTSCLIFGKMVLFGGEGKVLELAEIFHYILIFEIFLNLYLSDLISSLYISKLRLLNNLEE